MERLITWHKSLAAAARAIHESARRALLLAHKCRLNAGKRELVRLMFSRETFHCSRGNMYEQILSSSVPTPHMETV